MSRPGAPSSPLVRRVLDLIAEGEGSRVEFKSSFQKEVLETLAAFANTKGGVVLLGVRDDGAIQGMELHTESVAAWINQCKLNTSPSVIPDVETIEVQGKTVALFSVDEFPIKPVACKGRYYKRVQNSNHPMTPTEISDAHIKLINSSWDFHPDPAHTLDSISREKVQAFANALAIASGA